MQVGLGKFLLHIGSLKRADHLAQIAFHHPVEIVEGQADAVIGDPVLRKVVGADFFLASARTDLALASARSISLLLRAACPRATARA